MYLKKQKNNCRAQALLEYSIIILLILATILFFQRYIVQGFLGRWRSTGETWAHGRQFDPELTTRCAYYEGGKLTGGLASGIWYESDCFDANCIEACFSYNANAGSCLSCMNGCSTARCRAEGPDIPPVENHS